MEKHSEVRIGLFAMLGCYLLWGFQPLYWAIDDSFDFMFLMAARTLSAAVFCTAIVAAQGHLGQIREVFRSPKILMREIPAAVFLFGDWFVYIWAVQNGQVLECSVGYYIMPLVVFAFGALIFREKCRPFHFVALAFMIAAIVIPAVALGTLPWVSVSLSLMFSIYAAIKKSLTLDSIVSTTCEIIIMAPFMLVYMLLFRRGEGGMASVDALHFLYLVGAGIVTASPMLFYSIAVKRLRLLTVSIGQYLSPTLAIVCSLILHEEITPMKLLTFGLIWIGIVIFAAGTIKYKEL